MVFESIVTDLLNKYLGEYVENLDSSQLRIGIWGGDVVLHNLVLKQSALDELDLPIRTIFGVLEKLVLKIPWKNLYNDKVEAYIERLFLLAVPNQEVKYDPVKEERWNQEAKQLQLKKVEDAKKREAEKGMVKPDDSFVEKLTTQIIKNVEVKIGEIHIRYEDRISNIGRPFALGVTLYNLAVQTTDSQWKKCIQTEALNFIYKELTLEGLSVYLNCNSVQFSEKSPEEMMQLFKSGIVTRDETPAGYDYILGPINSSARLRMNPKPEIDGSDYTIPKMELTLQLETLSVGIAKNQHQDLMLLMESLDWMMRAAPYRKYRPFVSGYHGNYKSWWHFAYKCILEEEVRRRRRNWDWRFMRVHRDMCKTYAELYRQKVLAKKPTQDLLERIHDLEKRLDVFNIVLIRQRIEVQVAKDIEEQKKQQQERKGWFSSWWGGGSSVSDAVEPSTAADLAKKIEAAMTPEEKAKLYRAIDYNENAVPAIYPVTFVENKFSFKMNSLVIRLKNEEIESGTVLLSSLQEVNALVEQRKSGQALKVTVKIQKFTVEGTQQEGLTPTVVSSKLLKDPDAMLLDVLFETQPLDDLCDQRIRVEARPLRIIYDACTVNNIIDLFKPPEAPTLQTKLQNAIQTPALKEMSVFGMQYAVEKQTRLDISIDFMSSHIVIPQSGLYRGEENALIANLGRMTVTTVHKDSAAMNIRDMHLRGRSEADILNEMMARSYTRFILKLEDIQVLLAYAGEDWKKILLHVDQSPLHLVRPFSFTMQVDKCAVLDDPRLPKIRIAAELGDINLELPEDRLLCCINLPSTIPFNVAEPVPLGQAGQSDNASRSSQQSLLVEKLTGKVNKGGVLPKNILPKLEKDVPPLLQAIELQANFVLNRVFITLFVQKPASAKSETEPKETESEDGVVAVKEEKWDANLAKLLMFRLLNFEMEYVMCTFDTKMNMTLGLVDLTQQYDGYDIEIVGTPKASPEDQYLFNAKFVQVDRKSPEFRTVHESVLKRIDVDFSSLNVILHQEAMLNLIAFVNDFQSRLDRALTAPSSKTSTQKPPSRKLTTITEDIEVSQEANVLTTKPKSVMKRRKHKPSSIVELKIVLKLSCVGAQLVTADRPIASVSICGAFVTIALKKKSTELTVRLSDVFLLDMSPRTHFKKVLSYADEDVLSASVAIYDLDDHEDVNDVDMVVKVRMGCMHLVFINYFVSSLTGFLNNFQAAQAAVYEASAAAAIAARENAKDVYAKASKMSLDIELKAPIVTIPVNSFSTDGFLVDLGRLSIVNTFETRKVKSQAIATLDNISLTLDSMKLSRVYLEENSHVVTTECGVLKPISFKLRVVRNLSAAWFNDAPELDISAELQAIELSLSEGDYTMAMKVLSENLGDVPEDIPKSVEAAVSQTTVAVSKSGVPGSKEETTVGTPVAATKVHIFMKFSFSMESLVVALYSGGAPNVDQRCLNDKNTETGLARFTLNGLSLHGFMRTDKSLHTSMSLVDCLLDDLRFGRNSKIKRFMESKKIQPDPEHIPSNLSFDENNFRMMALTLNMDSENLTDSIDLKYMNINARNVAQSLVDLFPAKGRRESPKNRAEVDLDIYMDMLVNSFSCILSIDFLMNVKDFFLRGLPPSPEQTRPTPSAQSVVNSQSAALRATNVIETAAKTTPVKMTKIHLKLEQPDIIMVETMDCETTNALVLNVEVEFKVNIVEDVMTVNGSLRDFQLYVAPSFPNHAEETKALVISPATLDLNGGHRPEGLKLDVSCSALHIRVTPGTLELLSRCSATLQAAPVDEGEKHVENDYSNIWGRRSFNDPEFWFLKTEKAQEALELTPIELETKDVAKVISELVMVEFPRIILTLEAGVGVKTMPMILVETNFQGKVKDFSSLMAIESSLSLQVSYYNSRLALWEPLVEPVESIVNDQAVHYPWELKMEVAFSDQTNLNMDESQMSSIEEDVEAINLAPRMKVSLYSSANLELTITKTCLEVLNTLNEAFQSAMKSQLAAVTALSAAPYQVRNHTGITVNLNLESSTFQLANHDTDKPVEVVVLESGATIALELQERSEIPNSLISSPSKSRVERFLLVEPEKLNVSLNLPVVRADKRYFTLHQKGDSSNSQWGLISDVQVEDGGFIVTLRSIIQVHNHFNVPVNVYFMTERGNELESIGTVEPNGKINLPLPAVYTPTSELFFSVDGYSVSISPFKWRDLQNTLVMSMLLQCEPKSSEEAEPFFINAVGEMEQVFYENTSRHTIASTCYNVHLRPAVILKNYLPWAITCSLQGVPIQKKLEAGQHLQIPTVEPGSSTIVLTIPDYLEKQWSCKSPVKANPPELSVWPFESFDSMEKVTLNLGMHTITNNGSMIMALYAPFWMMNKTGLNLAYKHSDEGGGIFFHPSNFLGPILLPYHSKDFHAKKKAALKIEDEEWSSNFPLDVAGSSGQISCKVKGVLYQLGVHIELNSNSLTKRVLITPYHVILNNAPFAIECREENQLDSGWINIEPNDCCPLWPKSSAPEKSLRVRVAGTGEMSAPFSFSTVYTVLLRLHNKFGGLNLDVQMTEGGVYLSFTPYEPGLAPALFVNHTNCEVKIWESETSHVSALGPKECLLFAWEKPTGDRAIRWCCNDSKEITDKLRKDGLGMISTPDNQKIYWVSFLDGIQRVLLFTTDDGVAQDAQSAGEMEAPNMTVTVSIHGLGLSLVSNITKQELLYVGIASSGAIWETRKPSKARFKQLNTVDNHLMEEVWEDYRRSMQVDASSRPHRRVGKYTVNFEDMTVSQPSSRLLRRSFQTGLWINYRVSTHQVQIHVKVNRIQVDSQMPDCIFPVVFAPVPPPHSVALDKALKPFLEMSVVKRLTEHSPVQQYKYCKVLVQEFHVKVDVTFISAISAFFEAEAISEADEVKHFNTDMDVVKDPLKSHVALQSSAEQKNFYDLLHFSPLKIHISFSLGEEAGSSQNLPHILSVFMQSVGVTLTEMHDVVFKLAYLEREYVFLTQAQLVAEARMHYTGQLLKQFYVLVFGLDVIGNPFGLVVGLTKGVEDFFYEPFQGAIQGPGEFARGLVLGVRSLFGHTVGGAAGAASRITSTLGKGLAVLTFDDDYIRKRRENQNKRPANLHTGLAQSGKGLLMGVVDGVTGVVTKPVSGYKEGSWGGMFKGVGKGMAGLITRPTAGIVDFASGSFNAVKRATEMTEEVTRLRPPRYFQPDGVLRPYAKHEAEGNKVLQELEKGRYSTTDVYIHHIVMAHSGGKEIVLITDKRIAYLKSNDIFGGWQVDWAYTWTELAEAPSAVPEGIQIVANDQKKKKRLLGSSSNKRVLPIPDSEQRQRIIRKMDELYKKNGL